MKPHRIRQICRSHNPFTPSVALWQHFVLPWHPLVQQRPSSTALDQATSSNTEHDTSPPPSSSPPTPLASLEREPIEHNEQQFKIRKTASQASVKKRIDESALTSSAKVEDILSRTKKAFDESEDYEGIIVEPLETGRGTPEKELPWTVGYRWEIPTPAHERLSLEIARFYEHAKPSRNEALARKQAIEQVRTHARQAMPDYILEVFGSERTGIALATSDIDLRLIKREDIANSTNVKPPSSVDRKRLLQSLYKLRKKQFQKNKDYILPTLLHARYPLLSVTDRASGLIVQVVLANDTSVSRDFMRKYMEEFPYLRQLYFVVKTIFDSRRLSDVYRGGFGSYSIFMMIVASLKLRPPPRNDTASALQNFLDFWRDFDTSTKGISLEPPMLFDKSEEFVMPEKTKQQILDGKRKPLPKYMLCLCDPADPTNDLGRKGICIKHVQATLGNLAKILHWDCGMNVRYSFLKPLVGDIYSLNKAPRAKLENQGRRVLESMHSSLAASARAIREEEIKTKQEEKIMKNAPGESATDDFAEAVISTLGMPGVEELKKHVPKGQEGRKGRAGISYQEQDNTAKV